MFDCCSTSKKSSNRANKSSKPTQAPISKQPNMKKEDEYVEKKPLKKETKSKPIKEAPKKSKKRKAPSPKKPKISKSAKNPIKNESIAKFKESNPTKTINIDQTNEKKIKEDVNEETSKEIKFEESRSKEGRDDISFDKSSKQEYGTDDTNIFSGTVEEIKSEPHKNEENNSRENKNEHHNDEAKIEVYAEIESKPDNNLEESQNKTFGFQETNKEDVDDTKTVCVDIEEINGNEENGDITEILNFIPTNKEEISGDTKIAQAEIEEVKTVPDENNSEENENKTFDETNKEVINCDNDDANIFSAEIVEPDVNKENNLEEKRETLNFEETNKEETEFNNAEIEERKFEADKEEIEENKSEHKIFDKNEDGFEEEKRKKLEDPDQMPKSLPLNQKDNLKEEDHANAKKTETETETEEYDEIEKMGLQKLEDIEKQSGAFPKMLATFKGTKLEDDYYNLDDGIQNLMIAIDNIKNPKKNKNVRARQRSLLKKLQEYADEFDDKCANSAPTLSETERAELLDRINNSKLKLVEIAAAIRQFDKESSFEKLDVEVNALFVEVNNVNAKKDDTVEKIKRDAIREIQHEMLLLAQAHERIENIRKLNNF